jgi:hypothetical protein
VRLGTLCVEFGRGGGRGGSGDGNRATSWRGESGFGDGAEDADTNVSADEMDDDLRGRTVLMECGDPLGGPGCCLPRYIEAVAACSGLGFTGGGAFALFPAADLLCS